MKKPTILIDVDSTLINSVETIFEIYKEETNQPHLKYHNDYQWDFTGLIDDSYKERAVELFNKKEFFDRVKLLPHAYDVLFKYKDVYDLKICSIHNTNSAIYKINCIKKHLPFIDKFIILPNNGKNFTKSSVDGEIIIDDKISCIEGNRKHRILFGEYGYNTTNISKKDKTILENNPYIKAKNWTEVDKILFDIYRKENLVKDGDFELMGNIPTK